LHGWEKEKNPKGLYPKYQKAWGSTPQCGSSFGGEIKPLVKSSGLFVVDGKSGIWLDLA